MWEILSGSALSKIWLFIPRLSQRQRNTGSETSMSPWADDFLFLDDADSFSP